MKHCFWPKYCVLVVLQKHIEFQTQFVNITYSGLISNSTYVYVTDKCNQVIINDIVLHQGLK